MKGNVLNRINVVMFGSGSIHCVLVLVDRTSYLARELTWCSYQFDVGIV